MVLCFLKDCTIERTLDSCCQASISKYSERACAEEACHSCLLKLCAELGLEVELVGIAALLRANLVVLLVLVDILFLHETLRN